MCLTVETPKDWWDLSKFINNLLTFLYLRVQLYGVQIKTKLHEVTISKQLLCPCETFKHEK